MWKHCHHSTESQRASPSPHAQANTALIDVHRHGLALPVPEHDINRIRQNVLSFPAYFAQHGVSEAHPTAVCTSSVLFVPLSNTPWCEGAAVCLFSLLPLDSGLVSSLQLL